MKIKEQTSRRLLKTQFWGCR